MAVSRTLAAAFRVRSDDSDDLALQHLKDGNTALPPAVPAPP